MCTICELKMKKKNNVITLLVTNIIVGLLTLNVQAQTNEKYYLPERNTYYTRSQHTYSFYESEDVYHDEYVPAVYTLLTDIEEAKNTSIWDFPSKYSVPWKVNNGYDIAYCLDLLVDINEVIPYNKIEISKSTYIDDSIKSSLIGIIKNSYPFITKDEMISRLINAGIFEYKMVDGNRIITSKGNPDASRNISEDELLSAVQMAIYYYSNPGVIDKIYFNTYMISARTVLKSAGLWSGEYETKGIYEEVRYNIQTIYNYLIGLKSSNTSSTRIEKMYYDEDNIYIEMNNAISLESNLKLDIYSNDNLIRELSLKDFAKDSSGNFIIDRSQLNFQNLKVRISGDEYLENEVVVYEASENKTDSQTLIGVSSVERPLDLTVSFQDLSIQKYTSKQEVVSGETFNYTISVSNPNDFTVKKVLVNDLIPSELDIISSDGNVNDNTVFWELSLNPNESKNLTIKVKVKKDIHNGQIVNYSTVSYSGEEKNSNEVVVKILNNPKTGIASTWRLLVVMVVAIYILSKKDTLKRLIVCK